MCENTREFFVVVVNACKIFVINNFNCQKGQFHMTKYEICLSFQIAKEKHVMNAPLFRKSLDSHLWRI